MIWRRMEWARPAAFIEEERITYRVLVWNP
jgi:hypothetical protein